MGQATIRALQRHYGGHKLIGLVRTPSKAIKALPGRKLIYTNGSRKHAEAVADRLGISEHFEDTFDSVAADLGCRYHWVSTEFNLSCLSLRAMFLATGTEF
ncbi:MAG: hypothetical protein ACSHYC_07985 [Alphaproteobacteria bacterium]